MPREIDCPDCGESGYIPPCKRIPCHPETECKGCGLGKCIPCICKKGKIKVYTESEVQKLIKQEREEILNIFENYKDKRDFYTWGEVQEAIKQREKEETK